MTKELDPPFNPQGMAILNLERKGMEYCQPPQRTNKRASRMQAAIVDVQKTMNPDEDSTLLPIIPSPGMLGTFYRRKC